MKLIVHGAGEEVGRSCIEIAADEKRILFDSGLKIDRDQILMPETPEDLPAIDAIFLSHAHLDHSGALPFFTANGLAGPIYANTMTKVISNILLKDSWKIDMINNRNPSYRRTHITEAIGNIQEINYDVEYHKHGLTFTYFDAGHIPGSASILLKIEDKNILYTGDINSQDTALLHGASFFKQLPPIDVMITESTYGNRVHPDREKEKDAFITKIHETIENGGNVIIPTFAVGRAQEILLYLKDEHFDVPIYLDGMATEILNHYLQYMTYIKDFDALENAVKQITPIKKNPQRRKAIENRGIFITTSGMLDGGPVIEYLKQFHDQPKSSILLTGFQVETSNGARLLKEKKVNLDGKEYAVTCFVKKYDFSAHSGKTQLHKMIKTIKPKHLLLVHGDPEGLQDLETFCHEKGIDVTTTHNGEEYSL